MAKRNNMKARNWDLETQMHPSPFPSPLTRGEGKLVPVGELVNAPGLVRFVMGLDALSTGYNQSPKSSAPAVDYLPSPLLKGRGQGEGLL